MTPEEKSKELVNKFRKEAKIPSKDYDKAKQCALICVDGQIKTLQTLFHPTNTKLFTRRIQNRIDSLNEIRIELEKL